jgi:hypothetical protein
MLGVGVFGAALALLFSVWGRKPSEVLLAVYLVEMAWVLAYPVYSGLDAMLFKTGVVPDWLRDLNPFVLAFAPYDRPGTLEWADYAWFLLATFGAAAACTLLAVVCVRPFTLRHDAVTGRPRPAAARARRRWGPVLDRDPLRWYEWHCRRPPRWARGVWWAYAIAAVLGSGLVVYALGAAGRPGAGGAVVVNMLQLPVGLLLAGVGTVTALADERARGSLDVLLTTPLPTPAVVRAKWRAAFRPMARLAVLPVLVAAAVAWNYRAVSLLPWWAVRADNWYLVPLLAGLILTYGAALTSLGLALATWVPRAGRAIGAWVAAYALLCLGWPVGVMLLSGSGGGIERIGPALASPFFGSGVITELLDHGRPDDAFVIAFWAVLWTLLLLAAAAVLYWLTVVTFDRCLGRVPERGQRQPPRFAGRRNGV